MNKKHKITLELSTNEMMLISRYIRRFQKVTGSWLYSRWQNAIINFVIK